MSLDKEIKKLQQQVSENQMSRRRFMQGAMALGVGALAPSLYSEAAKAAPKKGGVYRMGLGGANTGDSLDPATNGDTFTENNWTALTGNGPAALVYDSAIALNPGPGTTAVTSTVAVSGKTAPHSLKTRTE